MSAGDESVNLRAGLAGGVPLLDNLEETAGKGGSEVEGP